MPLQPKRILVVFDFDWSFVDQDTDRWVFEVNALHLRRKMEDMEKSVQWTDLVAMMLREGHAEGITRDQVEGALKILPVHPAMIRAVTRLKASEDQNATFFCLSNANQVFIDTILKDKKLDDLFYKITTNPAEWREDGLLVVRRRVDPTGPQHTCTVGCSPNMCKGEELTAFLVEHGEYDKVVYIGDGSNDFCPVVRLREQDTVFARTARGLQRRIEREGAQAGLKCKVVYWEGAWEIEEAFATL
ncbi:hypothetical protein FRC19_004815 [Serendipita sp. 401]|nr:hypothetical protein FRC19_004815 [Serendipita sp. 401]KAG8835862.1 hypothetical protein FRC18_012245 [Serendipita sp. 400]KAG9054793.1 hypothetical protein FS842_004115 [Serendipita sp. 407]